MTVRKFRVPMRLATMIKASGGKMVRDSMRDSAANMAGLRESCLASIDALMAELTTSYSPRNTRSLEDLDRVFEIGSDLIDCAACVPELNIEGAAHSLCKLADLCRDAEKADWQAVDVHIEVLRFLRAAGAETSAAAREKMVGGLRKVVARSARALGIEDDDSGDALTRIAV